MAGLERRGAVEDSAVLVTHTATLNPETPIHIGHMTTIHGKCVLKGHSPISVGRYCEIAEGVHIVSSNHDSTRASLNVAQMAQLGIWHPWETKGPVQIGHNVWIGDNAIVLSGVQIGNGAIVGAGAVVSRDVAPFTVVAGSPARVIRKRFPDEVIAALEELAWWDWPLETMLEQRDLFERDLTEVGAAEFLHQRISASPPPPLAVKV